MARTWEEYLKQAQSELSPTYESQRGILQTNMDTDISALNANRPEISARYNQQEQQTNLDNSLAKNNFSSQNLSRGMARSSYVTTGMAGMDNTTNRILSNIRNFRDIEMNKLDTDINNTRSRYTSQIAGLGLDNQGQIYQRAREMQQYDTTSEENKRQYDEKMAWDREQFDRNEKLQREQMVQSERISKASSSDRYKNEDVNSSLNKEKDALNDIYSGQYNLSEKIRVLQRYIEDMDSKFGDDAKQLSEYAKYILGKVQGQMSDYVNIGRYAGYGR
jgi:hypothetical protein